MARLYADENVARRLLESLREYGHDVLTSHQAGKANLGLEDDVVLSDAFEMERIVLTNNRRDFRRLHQEGSNHVGIVDYTLDTDLVALAGRIHTALTDPRATGRFYAGVTQDGYTLR